MYEGLSLEQKREEYERVSIEYWDALEALRQIEIAKNGLARAIQGDLRTERQQGLEEQNVRTFVD